MVGTVLLTTAIAGGANVATAIDQRKAGKRAERRQKHANRIEKAKAEVQRAVERKRSISIARQAQASNIAAGVSEGITAGSSALQGAQAALGSNLARSAAEANRSFVSGQQSFDLRQSASSTQQNAAANAAITGAVTGYAQQAGSFALGLPQGSPSPAAPASIAAPTSSTRFDPSAPLRFR